MLRVGIQDVVPGEERRAFIAGVSKETENKVCVESDLKKDFSKMLAKIINI